MLGEIISESGRPIVIEDKSGSSDNQISFASTNDDEIRAKLKKIDINTLTPIEAMQTLYELISLTD